MMMYLLYEVTAYPQLRREHLFVQALVSMQQVERNTSKDQHPCCRFGNKHLRARAQSKLFGSRMADCIYPYLILQYSNARCRKLTA